MVAEHKNGKLSPSTLNTISAASALGTGDLSLLVAGAATESATQEAQNVTGVHKILTAQHEALGHHLAEPWSELLRALQAKSASSKMSSPALPLPAGEGPPLSPASS